MSERHEWRGEYGPCVVGKSYAQGDREDLATEILRLLAVVKEDEELLAEAEKYLKTSLWLVL